MKTILRFMVWTVIALCSTAMLAQDVTIEHYSGDNTSTNRPDFTKAPIAIDFDGKAGAEAKKAFAKLGARDFVQQVTCSANKTVICAKVLIGTPVNTSSYSYGSAYGNRGGYSSNASFNGQWRGIQLMVSLITFDPITHQHQETPLGIAIYTAAAGSGTESDSSYNRRGGFSFQFGGSNGFESSIPIAVNNDIIRLLGGTKNPWKLGMTLGTYTQWFPGASQLVEQTFRPQPMPLLQVRTQQAEPQQTEQ
jgi:hypothetical protein